MLNQISEKKLHRIRLILTGGWLLLIFSLFYDPITAILTNPNFEISPFSIDLDACVKLQGECLLEQPYGMGVRIWWAAIVPAGIFIIFVLGHEFWRRICPLAFLSQIPAALGLQRKKKVINPITGKVTYKLVVIGQDSWLGKNHLYVQFLLFFLGLVSRILFTNSDRTILGLFLIFTIGSAIIVGYLYAGKSWCQYFCPMSTVQTVFTGPRGLLGSKAHEESKTRITQSMCRTIDSKGQEKTACVGCKSACIDIDAERTYWKELKKPGRRLIQYGYFGIMYAFYFYYFAYAGNWEYYFSGAWTHEENLAGTVFAPGFYIFERAIFLPKILAVSLTFACFIALSYLFFFGLEQAYRAYMKHRDRPVSKEKAQHVIFTISTVVSFWVFFSFGGRPNLNLLPDSILIFFDYTIIVAGSLWFYRTINRTVFDYKQERIANSLREQLKKLDIDISLFLEGRSLDELNPKELYILTKVLPNFHLEERKRLYIIILRENLE